MGKVDHMNIQHAENKKYLKLAIQTTLFKNREHVLKSMENSESLIELMSEEICFQAQRFQEITDAVICDCKEDDKL